MKTVSEIPAVPEIVNCQKHGDYEVKYMDFFGKIKAMDACSKCVKDKELADIAREKQDKERSRISNIKLSKEMAGVSPRYLDATFNAFNQDRSEQKEAVTLLKKLCADIKENNETQSIIITGKVGTGKTMLCSAVINELCQTRRVKIVKLIHLVRLLKDTWKKGSTSSELDIIHDCSNLDLLIIDEIGMQFGSDTEKMFMFDIIDGRYENIKPTILISNLNTDGITEIIGERVVDRLRDGGGDCLSFDWESGRK